MLSSKKASSHIQVLYKLLVCVLLIQFSFSGFVLAESKEKALARFPPEPIKFARTKKVVGLILPSEPSASEMPFWRNKVQIRKKMLEDRLISVSVNTSTLPSGMVAFDVKGAGIVHAPRESAIKTSLEFDQLTKVSSNFKSSYYDEKNSQLFVVIEALGFETRMILAIDRVVEKKRSEIQFEVVWGELKGMAGAIGFENVNDESCEVSILSHYEAAKLPLPKVFIGFAFEVVTQKIAEKMRSFIESQK